LSSPEIDKDAADFCAATGATDLVAISKFCTGLKQLGLWSSVVCWPMRLSQNHQTGTSVRQLGGLAGSYGGTLVNTPTRSSDGIEFVSGQDKRVNIPTPFGDTSSRFLLAVAKETDSVSGNGWVVSGNSHPGVAIFPHPSQNKTAIFGQPGTVDNFGKYTGQRIFIGFTANATTVTAFRDYTVTNTGAGAIAAATQPMVLGQYSTGNGEMTGNISFVIAGKIEITQAQYQAIYNLYRATLGLGLSFPDDTIEYSATSYVTDTAATDQKEISNFSQGIKDLGLWNNMVFWLTRSAQSFGTGTANKSFGGLSASFSTSTLVNGMAWSADGVVDDGTADKYASSNGVDVASWGQFSVGVVHKLTAAPTNENYVLLISRNNGSGYRPSSSIVFTVYCASPNYDFRVATYTMTGGDSSRYASKTGTLSNILNNGFHYFAGSIGPSPTFTRVIGLDGNFSQNGSGGTGTAFTNSSSNETIMFSSAQASAIAPAGVGSFAFLANIALSQTQHESIRTLYKNTLGKGLSLP
jgi:hypothetical protein